MGASASQTGLSSDDGAASVSTLRASIPSALRDFACTISKRYSTVFIDCDEPALADEVFEWLSDLADAQAIEAGTDETLQAAQPEGRERGPKDAPHV